ncbi:hypothetical protein, partial [Succinimonas amylolytica]|uniref:hypothetical protein n=1 Tax=Succinimonas amylolytica TaxID=83769 RepID=UPI001B7F7E7F
IISTDGWYDVEWLKNPDGTYKAKLVGCLVHLRRYNMNSWKVLKHRDHITMSTSEHIRTGSW